MSNACKEETKYALADHECCSVEAAPRESAVTIQPLADVFERENDYQIILDLPGVSNDAIDVQVLDSRLTVRAECDLAAGRPEVERPHAQVKYKRSFKLSRAVDQSAMEASLNSGVLTIAIPKSAESQPRKIEVSAN